MPRFFFDVSYSDQLITDSVGIDLKSVDDVATEGYHVLRGIVHDKMPEGRFVLTIVVRDASGAVVYRGKMTINGERFHP